jgi:periplasmic divalent cation tolerance protein
MQPEDLLIVFVTCPPERAAGIADLLVIEKLAACVNIFPVNSVYFWKNEIQHDNESLLIIKTTTRAYDELANRLKELHPYEVPEIVAVKVSDADEPYLKWIEMQTGPSAE